MEDFKPKVDLSDIRNKMKRQELYLKMKADKAKEKKKLKEKRRREEKEGTAEERVKKTPRTIENTRKEDETFVQPDDEEILGDEAIDEFSSYYSGPRVKPKLLITTGTANRSTRVSFDFVRELLLVFPNSFYYGRKGYPLKELCAISAPRGYTDILVVHEDRGKIVGLMLIHLPRGPTAYFKVSSVQLPKEIPGHAKASTHRPEVVLNNFNTRLGHRVGRMFGALFDQQPNFVGRRVVTFHNQRDYIFFRHHRYIFDTVDKARLQECGPRFTLKLRYLQHNLPDSGQNEYEFMRKREIGNGKKDFFI